MAVSRLARCARLGAVVVLTAALVVTGAPAAFAKRTATFTILPVSAAAMRRSLGIGALATGLQVSRLPTGTYLSGGVQEFGNNQDVFQVPLRAGQHVSLKLTGSAGTDFALELWKNGDPSTDPVADDYRFGYPKTVEFDVKTTGWYDICVWAGTDSGSGYYTLGYGISDPAVTTDVSRIAGANRVTTSVKASQSSYPATASAVVVATGWDFADGIAASSLCGSYDAPLLLTDPKKLSAEVDAEIDRLKPRQVFVVGSAAAVSDDVFRSLEDTAAGRVVTRLGGGTRVETANKIAVEVKAHENALGRKPNTVAFLVDGYNYPDALAVSPYAYRRRMPIFLATKTSLPKETKAAMVAYGVTKTFVIGSKAAVSDAVKAALPDPAPGELNERIYGDDRVRTSWAAADYAARHGWGSWSYLGLANGWGYADALAGGVAAGKAGGIIMLTEAQKLHDVTSAAVYDKRSLIDRVRLFGGRSVLFGCVMGDVDADLHGNGPVYWR